MSPPSTDDDGFDALDALGAGMLVSPDPDAPSSSPRPDRLVGPPAPHPAPRRGPSARSTRSTRSTRSLASSESRPSLSGSRARIDASSFDRLRKPSNEGDRPWIPPVTITSQARDRTSWTAAAAALGERPPDGVSQNSISSKLKELRSGQFGRGSAYPRSLPASSPRLPSSPALPASPATAPVAPGASSRMPSAHAPGSAPSEYSTSQPPRSAPATSQRHAPAHARPSAAAILAQASLAARQAVGAPAAARPGAASARPPQRRVDEDDRVPGLSPATTPRIPHSSPSFTPSPRPGGAPRHMGVSPRTSGMDAQHQVHNTRTILPVSPVGEAGAGRAPSSDDVENEAPGLASPSTSTRQRSVIYSSPPLYHRPLVGAAPSGERAPPSPMIPLRLDPVSSPRPGPGSGASPSESAGPTRLAVGLGANQAAGLGLDSTQPGPAMVACDALTGKRLAPLPSASPGSAGGVSHAALAQAVQSKVNLLRLSGSTSSSSSSFSVSSAPSPSTPALLPASSTAQPPPPVPPASAFPLPPQGEPESPPRPHAKPSPTGSKPEPERAESAAGQAHHHDGRTTSVVRHSLHSLSLGHLRSRSIANSTAGGGGPPSMISTHTSRKSNQLLGSTKSGQAALPDRDRDRERDRRSPSIARRSINRASMLIRRSVAKVFPGLEVAGVMGLESQAAGASGGAHNDHEGTGGAGASHAVPEMEQANCPPPYAAHMRSTSGLHSDCAGAATLLTLDHPRAEWGEWNVHPGGPGARFWHRFSLAVQHQGVPISPAVHTSPLADAGGARPAGGPSAAPARAGAAASVGRAGPGASPVASGLHGTGAPTPWLATERAQSKRFTRVLVLAIALVAIIAIAATLGATLSHHHHHSHDDGSHSS